MPSSAELLASLPSGERATLLATLSPDDLGALAYDWTFWGRPSQFAPLGDWMVWLILAGRGFGKTRTGAEWVRGEVEAGRAGRIALVSDTAADVRDVMIEGPAGLLAVCPPWNRPHYESTKRRVTWPNGATAIAYAAEAPELLRGPQHDLAWADELSKWQNLRTVDRDGGTAWDNLLMGLRIGVNPRVAVTTTPRPIALVKALMADPLTVVTGGSTFENASNLSPAFLSRIKRKYEGTRLGRQELHAEVLDDVPGALWTRAMLEGARVLQAPPLVRIVVGVDPAATSGEDSAETGIVVAGLGADGHGYVIGDGSLHGTPDAWARAAVTAYLAVKADRLVGEVNNGGEMVEHTLRTVYPALSYRAVHASRGKLTRAEPIAALYEQGRVHHVGVWPDLEDQLCTWVPAPGVPSPDRLDALVWALTDLLVDVDAVTEPVRYW